MPRIKIGAILWTGDKRHQSWTAGKSDVNPTASKNKRFLFPINYQDAFPFLGQSFNSASTFLLTFLLMQQLSARDYGQFSLLQSIVIFWSGLIAAITTNPIFLLNRETTNEGTLKHYWANAGRPKETLYISAILAITICTASTNLYSPILVNKGSLALLVIIMTTTAGAITARDYLNRALYAVTAESLLFINGASLFLFVVIVEIFWQITHKTITPQAALIALACGNSASVIITTACLLITNAPPRNDLNSRKIPRKTIYQKGLISCGAHLAIFSRLQGYTLIITPIVGMAGLGIINAARTSIAIFSVILPVIAQKYSSELLAARNLKKQERKLKYYILVSFLVAANTLLILGAYKIIPHHGLDKYGNLSSLILFWCLFSLAQATRTLIECEITVKKGFYTIASCNTFCLAFSLPMQYLGAKLLSLNGAVLALAISEFMMIFVYKIFSNRRWNRATHLGT